MQTPQTQPNREQQKLNREIEFKELPVKDMEAPIIGILVITAAFIFIVLLYNIFSPTTVPKVHQATPATESTVSNDPFPMPIPNIGPTPNPAPQR